MLKWTRDSQDKYVWNFVAVQKSVEFRNRRAMLHWSEKAMAPHSSTLAWKIPWMEEPGRLQSMGSRRVGCNWATSLSLFTFMHWRRKWQPTLAWRIPGMGEPGGLPSLGSHRVGHDWSDLAAAAAAPLMDRIVWRALAQQAANNKHSTDKQRNEKMTLRLLHWKRQAVC